MYGPARRAGRAGKSAECGLGRPGEAGVRSEVPRHRGLLVEDAAFRGAQNRGERAGDTRRGPLREGPGRGAEWLRDGDRVLPPADGPAPGRVRLAGRAGVAEHERADGARVRTRIEGAHEG